MKINYSLKIGWLYPQLMSTYGDKGNVMVLQKRCEWRGIKVEILPIDQSTSDKELQSIDLLFGGGAQDREQEIVMENLRSKKKIIQDLIEEDVPALFVCGAPQLMGKYYETAEGRRIEGLGIFDMHTKHPGPKDDRLIGNLVAQGYSSSEEQGDESRSSRLRSNNIIVGFENHGGRTFLGKNAKAFAKVLKGFGNNGIDLTEGVIYKNAIGCYLHGPLLPKNPIIADYLIQKALEVKYKKKIHLATLDDSLEEKAKSAIAQRLGIRV
ncbi:MAG: cobalamin biosynthesis protein CobQ [Candidatus Levybacteria bacterium]|nr:cobalamin biosynthesis protein CobQ [Candidatus Levybacteria bacterium]